MKIISTGMFRWKMAVFLILCMLVQLFPTGAIPGTAIPKAKAETNFAHPGGWVTAEDITLVRSKLAASEQPWVKAKNSLLASGPKADYQPQPVPVVTREVGGTSPDGTDMKLRSDASNAYTLMIKWVATGDIGYADAAIRIIDGWSAALVEIKGFDDRLAAAIYGNKMAQAAELAAYAVPDWPNKPRAQAMFRNVFYSLIKDGAKANWGTTAMACIISMSVFLDDQAMFDQAVTAFKAGFPNLRHYAGVTEYIDETGENAESGRDQGHSQSGVAHLVETAVVAYNQGINLFAYGNNRLLLGMEYLAKYNLGYDVPYHPFIIIDGPLYPNGISSIARGVYKPIYEMAYNYFTAAGVTGSVYTQQVIQSSGYAPEKTHFDHPGFGTLIFTVVPLRASQPAQQKANLPAGAYKLKNPNSGRFLEAAGAGTEDGTPVQINPDSSIENQRWIITPSGDGTYQIVDSNSKKVLAASEGTDNGAAVYLSTQSGGLDQKWTVDDLGNGTYKFVSANNHKALHVAGNGKSNGTPVQLWEDNGFYGQRWQLITDNEAPTPPTNLKANAVSDNLINLSWTESTDNVGIVGYAVYRDGVKVGTTRTTAYSDTGLAAEASYSYTVKAFDNLLNFSAASSTADAATAAHILFTSKDIGPVGLAGSYSYDNGKYTVTGSGKDIWAAEDQFNFAYLPVTGDITVAASVYSQQNTNAWAKAGLMMRATLDANSPYAMLDVTPGNGVVFQWRSSSGGSTKQTAVAMQTVPIWLKLVRTGTLIEGYYSTDGTNWTTVGSANVPAIPNTAHVGLNVTSHNNTKRSTVVFDNVSITGPHRS
jgi:regulation of enolase protein 1 (concanavalin A-like superfamily)